MRDSSNFAVHESAGLVYEEPKKDQKVEQSRKVEPITHELF